MTEDTGDKVRLLVGFSEGSASNIVARMIGPALGRALNKRVVIERIPGENGAICAERVARAAPDGQTVAIAIQANIVGSLIHTPKRYDPLTDFAPIALIAKSPLVLAVSNALGVKSVGEFIELARSNNDRLTYAASALGGSPHVAGMLFSQMAGVSLRLCLYEDTDKLYADLENARIAATFNNLMSALPRARAGKLSLLAVTGRERIPQAPELPTLEETALRGYEILTYVGLVAPARTPQSIIARFNAATRQALHNPEVLQALTASGMTAVGSSPEAFAAHMRADIERWRTLLHAERPVFPAPP